MLKFSYGACRKPSAIFISSDRKNLEEMTLSLFKRIYESYASTEYGVRVLKSFPFFAGGSSFTDHA
jgi:hypothetical protein